MSKFDKGVHIKRDSELGSVPSKKRLDPQRPPKNLEARREDFGTLKNLQGFHKPGSQNRNK